MRLIYISQYFPPEVGATQTRAQEMTRHLVKVGHQVTVLTEVPNHPVGVIQPAFRGKLYRRTLEDGVDVLRVWVKTTPHKTFRSRLAFYLSFMVNATFAGLLLARGRYDLIYATSPPLFVGGVALALNAMRRIPFVFEVRDLWPESAVAMGELSNPRYIRWATRLENRCYRQARHVVTVTRGLKDRLIERGIPESKISVIPNGANTELFRPMPQVGAQIRSRLKLTDQFIVMYAGLLGVAQGLHTLVEAARLMQGEPVHFVFVGDGPTRSSLEERVKEYSLSNVTFTGVVPRTDVPRFLAAADIAVVIFTDTPLFKRSLPSKMFDALACGRPVLLSAPEGEAASVLEQSAGGVHVVPESPEAIVGAVRHLVAYPDQLDRFGKRSRQLVEAHYSRQVQARQLEEVLRATISG
jgi:glycosyltransferase involved in cell wall biosynthesis